MKLRNEIIGKVANKKNIYNKRERYYVLKHTHDIEPRPVIVKSKLDYKTMDLLVAYLQFKADELQHAYDFDQEDMGNLLVKHFGCELLDSYDGGYFDIDLYESWEFWAGDAHAIMGIDNFKNEELLNDLIELTSKAS